MNLSEKITKALSRMTCAFRVPEFIFRRLQQLKAPFSVVYLVENANWSIKWDGVHTTKYLRTIGRKAVIDISSRFQAGKILHYGSSYVFETQFFKSTGRHNKHIVTFFHGRYGEDPLLDKRFDLLKANIANIDAVAYANTIMRARLIELGVPDNKLFHVPIGVDLDVFKPLSSEERQRRRKALGIPEGAFVIGSFQKDGQGWGEGFVPKLIKGPDIFVEAVAAVAKTRPVFCLLSGPARGYVKKGLEAADIPYLHEYYDNPDDVVGLYQLLDAYLVSSREEGGPKSILESLACGVPLVTTDVGMARDVLEGQNCGFICASEDVKALSESLLKLAQDACLSKEFSVNSQRRIQDYSWRRVAEACEAMYKAVEARS
jgi:glycosyltransferase involved in cell wall biosynthesis